MTEECRNLWQAAGVALEAARRALQLAFDTATVANRAYYAAFYAVSALFAAEGKVFTKHAAVEAAVHRDLVNADRWSSELGAAFSRLHQLRSAADYDVAHPPSSARAEQAVQEAEQIVEAVRLVLIPAPGESE
jgi:uncharacterized protein (UPF0332 family)